MSAIRYLTATTGCAVLLGLAVTGFVRAQLSALEQAAATRSSETSIESTAPSRASEVCTTVSDQASVEATARRETSKAGASASLRASAKRHPSKSKRSSQMERGGLLDELDRGVKQVGDGRYEITRTALDLALGNLALLSRSVRVAPDMRDGKPVGFRLFAIAEDGPFAKLGLRDEDVLVSINHLSLTTVEQVLDAYGKLKTAKHLVLGILRAGRKIAFEYRIR